MIEQKSFLVNAQGPDGVGIVTGLTGALFDMGANLSDCGFDVLGTLYDFSAVVDMPASYTAEEICAALQSLPTMAASTIAVTLYTAETQASASGRATHRVMVSGGDRPGLVARLSEVMASHGANIVNFSSKRFESGGVFHYETRFEIYIADAEGAVRLDAALTNTAGSLGLSCAFSELTRISTEAA